jgi:hypothetical protein
VVDPVLGFARVNGTSFATPILAGAAALYRQLHPTHSPVEVIGALRRTATEAGSPDSSRGWGRPDGAVAAYFPRGLTVVTPEDTALKTATPTFSWLAPEVPPVAQPLSYRLQVATDATFTVILLDTTVVETTVTWAEAQRPGARFVFRLTATAPDGVGLGTPTSPEFVAPPWATLLTLNDPEGTTTREVRPSFQWSSPGVASPPGPFVYDVAIFRADNGQLELEERDLNTTSYVPPRDLERNTPYTWQVTAHLAGDSAVTESLGTFLIIDDTVPAVTLLFQNFPNPFPAPANGRRATCIWFDLATRGRTVLDILDSRGHVVRNLVPAAVFPPILEPGRYGRPTENVFGSCDPNLEWDGTATDGTHVPQGIYLVRLSTPDGTFFKRIVYMGPDF